MEEKVVNAVQDIYPDDFVGRHNLFMTADSKDKEQRQSLAGVN